ncbi:unnamed protein product [uncultured bacterium]|nr:unnamed protein product [uncultured bacterium]
MEFAELSDFCIRKPPHLPLRECRGATVAFRLNGREHYYIFFGKDMMNFDGEDTTAKSAKGCLKNPTTSSWPL